MGQRLSEGKLLPFKRISGVISEAFTDVIGYIVRKQRECFASLVVVCDSYVKKLGSFSINFLNDWKKVKITIGVD